MSARIHSSVAVAIALIALLSSAPSASAAQPDIPKATVVLVHGAWADSSSWAAVVRRLQRTGYKVAAPGNPLRGLASDAAYLRSYLGTIDGPVVLAGHSYGGAVITNAAANNPNVKALVYADAYLPDQGEDVVHLTGAQPGSALGGDPAAVFDFRRPRPVRQAQGVHPSVCKRPLATSRTGPRRVATGGDTRRTDGAIRTPCLEDNPVVVGGRDGRPRHTGSPTERDVAACRRTNHDGEGRSPLADLETACGRPDDQARCARHGLME
jgi:pimeloyl-ACP methyl ester carboxylesterase